MLSLSACLLQHPSSHLGWTPPKGSFGLELVCHGHSALGEYPAVLHGFRKAGLEYHDEVVILGQDPVERCVREAGTGGQLTEDAQALGDGVFLKQAMVGTVNIFTVFLDVLYF